MAPHAHHQHQEEPAGGDRRGRGKIAHQPEGHTAQLASRDRGHQKHDERRKKRRGDDPAEQQRVAVQLASPAPQKVDGGGGRHRTGKRSERCGSRQLREPDEGKNRAQRRPARDAQHVRVGQGISQQCLETGPRHRERRTDDHGQQNPRPADVQNDEPEIGGHPVRLAQRRVVQKRGQVVHGNGPGAEFQREEDDQQEHSGERGTGKQELAESQRAHQSRPPRRFPGSRGFEAGVAGNASGWSWRARSSMASSNRGAGRSSASLTTA